MCQSAETALRCWSKCQWPVSFLKDQPGMCYKKVTTVLFTFSMTRKSHPNLFLLSLPLFFFWVSGTDGLPLYEQKTVQPGTRAFKLGTLLLMIKYHLFWTTLISYQVHARFIHWYQGSGARLEAREYVQYLLLSRYCSFSTQKQFQQLLVGFWSEVKPRDRCSIAKNITSLS